MKRSSKRFIRYIRWTFMKRVSIAAALAFALVTISFATDISVSLAPEALVKSRLEDGVVKQRERQAVILDMFKQAGCAVQEQRLDKRADNVICTLPGSNPSTIIVGAHFDFADAGKGIVDDWTGAALLPSLYEALKNKPRTHTFVFVAFAGEERGLLGSKAFLQTLGTEQRPLPVAFVNLECLGLTPPKVWRSRATPVLVKRLAEVAAAIHVSVQGENVDKIGDDDSHPFLDAQVPVITLHSLTQETFRVLHTQDDRLAAVHLDYYYAAYRLAAYYLAYLDSF
jgi:hypothetical protein